MKKKTKELFESSKSFVCLFKHKLQCEMNRRPKRLAKNIPNVSPHIIEA